MAGMTSAQPHAVVNARRAARALPLCALSAIAPAKAGPPPSCLPPAVAAGARVANVNGDGTFRLEDRTAVRLESVLWPAVPVSIRLAGLAELRRLISGTGVALLAAAPQRDRYERLRAQVVLPDGTWLQDALLRHGLARVSLAPDRRECASELYAAEAAARARSIGLWAFPEFAVRTPESLRWGDLGTFQIVEGAVLNVKVSGSRAYLDFGRNWRTDFTVTIAPEDMKTFRHAGLDPYSYAGKAVRARGYIDRLHGFEIEAASPEAIEMLR